MAFPEKVTYPDKYNLRPIVDPDGQFSAENANHIKEKINKNALFHGVHDNLAALQAAWQNPTPGHFAYLLDGTHYRCVNVGWTTNEAGGSGNYFFGYHLSMEALEIAHPNAIPGARAIIKVEGGNDLEALWDEDDQHWFSFAIIPGGVSTDPYQALVLGSDNLPYLDLRTLNGGATPPSTSLLSYLIAWTGTGWKYRVTTSFIYNGISYNDTRELTLIPDPNFGRFARFAVNLQTLQAVVVHGDPSANPLEPALDPPSLYLDPDRLILIPANSAAPANVNSITIYAENLGHAGGEWQPSPNQGAAIDFANQEQPKSGTYAIKGSNLANNQSVILNAQNPVPVAQAKFVAYDIYNINGGSHSLMLQGLRSNGRQISVFLPDPTTVGYSASNTATYQTVILPIAEGNLVSIQNYRIIAGFAGFSFHIDNIRLVGGEGSGGGTIGDYALTDLSNVQQLNEAQSNVLKAKLLITDNVGASEQYVIDGDAATLQAAKDYADGLQVSDSVVDSFGTMAALYADRPNQLDGEIFIVIDASAHPTVGAGWALFEYLGTAFGNETDYRKLGEEESLDYVFAGEVYTTTEKNKLASITAIFTTALKTSYDTAASWVSTNGANVLARLGILERDPIIVSTSRLLTANDHNRTLLVTANVTLTWPAGGIDPFRCNFDIDSTGQLLIADQAGTAGADLDAPDGKIAEAGKMTHCYKRPENIKLRLKGTWKV